MTLVAEQLVERRLAGETKVLGENLSQCHLFTTSPTWPDPVSNPSRHGRSQRLTAWAMARPVAIRKFCSERWAMDMADTVTDTAETKQLIYEIWVLQSSVMWRFVDRRSVSTFQRNFHSVPWRRRLQAGQWEAPGSYCPTRSPVSFTFFPISVPLFFFTLLIVIIFAAVRTSSP
jgi:hypothetical protein